MTSSTPALQPFEQDESSLRALSRSDMPFDRSLPSASARPPPLRTALTMSVTEGDLRTGRTALGGSLSLGNQTLLQMLSAVGNLDRPAGGETRASLGASVGDDEDDASEAERDDALSDEGVDHDEDLAHMESSIHAIHRPIEFQRRRATEPPLALYRAEQQYAAGSDHPEVDATAVPIEPTPVADELERVDEGRPLSESRRTSSKTVMSKAERRAKLASMLKDIFSLSSEEEVIAELSCWLFRSVLLQGYLYLTTAHICFYAYVRNKEGKTLRSGSLRKCSNITSRSSRHWFILRDDSLTWYPSSTEPYFPDGDVSLQYCTSVEPSRKHPKQFKILTANRHLRFSADSTAARDDWVKTLRKAVFQCQNEGESVKIAIPLEAVLSIEPSTLDFIDMLLIKVKDPDEGFAADEYPFCYFADLAAAREQLQHQLDLFRAGTHTSPFTIERTETSVSKPAVRSSLPASEASLDSSLSRRKGAMNVAVRAASAVAKMKPSRSNQGVTTEPITAEPSSMPIEVLDNSTATMRTPAHTYPPLPSGSAPAGLGGEGSGWLSSAWIKGAASTPMRFVPTKLPPMPSLSTRKVSEVVGAPRRAATVPPTADSEGKDASDAEDEAAAREFRFRTSFSMPEKEELLAVFPANLFRLFPVSGKLYVSTNFLCFKPTNLSSVFKAKMVLPLRDIIAIQQHRGSRLGWSGLVLTIKGHEELFFEFGSTDLGERARHYINARLEEVHRDIIEGKPLLKSDELAEALRLRKLEPSSSQTSELPAFNATDDAPPVMFRSASSSFLTFRPPESLHITCLTIGSRGDVQPYIALCKGLIADGHRCRIATHAEYREWIEGHGIEFTCVGGDPAELMRICVENGMFTVSFLREGVTKFRGWLDDLLKTSWTACQGTDLLIESPSAMGGLHIAEALQIPYYRAFTMPWTKTRAYPHAFAVPEYKLGGQYNYLSYAMFDNVFWAAISGQINRWRKQTLGLRSTSIDKMDASKTPFLYNFSSAIVPPPLDWPEWIHVTGYWFLDAPDDSALKKWRPPSDLVAFLDKAKATGKKVVYIGFGSIVVSDPEALTQTVSEAVSKADVFAIVSKGWSDRLATKDDSAELKQERAEQEAKEREMMPESIYTVDAIPHDWLFDRIDAACHHGGAGTTGASLRAGIPTIIRSFFGDQFFWAARVETLGIGTALRKMTAETLAEALRIATTDEKQILRAKVVGQHIRGENGVANAIESIYRDLEYAKSLIKRDTKRPPEGAPLPAPTPVRPADRGPPTSRSQSRSRPSSAGHWRSGNETSDDGSSWDHLSRAGTGGDDTDNDDVLSRSGLGSSPALSPAASVSRRTSDYMPTFPSSDDEEADGEGDARVGKSKPRRSSDGTARSPTRRRRSSNSRFSRLSSILPAGLSLSPSRSREV